MRVDVSESNRRKPGGRTETPYQKQARRASQKRSTGRAIVNFFRDLQAGLLVSLFLFTLGLAALFGLRQMGYESELVAFKHIVAGTDCIVAEMLDMAPAKMEQPGYWMHLDADKDGTTCEEPRA